MDGPVVVESPPVRLPQLCAFVSLCLLECLAEGSADALTIPTLVALHQETGDCIVIAKHAAMASTELAFCARTARIRCRADVLLLGQTDLSALIEQVNQLGTEHLSCAIDSGLFASFLGTLTAPAHPVLAKLGAAKISGLGAEFAAVDSCASVGLLESPFVSGAFARHIPEAELQLYRRAPLLLDRYATQTPCRQSLPLTDFERKLNQEVLSGSAKDFIACDRGQGDDPAFSSCPAAVP